MFNYDRRGRGDSGDTPPYAVEREIEDIGAVIEAGGGTANLYGTSSGAALALDAAAEVPVMKLALWEPPYILDESNRPPDGPGGAVQHDDRRRAPRRRRRILHDQDRPLAARVRGSSPRRNRGGHHRKPWRIRWPTMQRSWATTRCPSELPARVKAPTLVLAGGSDYPWMRETALALSRGASRRCDPHARRTRPQRRSGGARSRTQGVLRRLRRRPVEEDLV